MARLAASPWAALAASAAVGVVLVGCTTAGAPGDATGSDAAPTSGPASEPGLVEAPPRVGACRALSPADVTLASNATEPVSCAQPHTAETYAVGQLPESLTAASYDDPEVARFAYRTCERKFTRFLGADVSLAMRTVLNWAWFRPSPAAWEAGARWYRCDVVGGGEQSEEYYQLPTTAQGLLDGRPDDRWMVCAAGETVAQGPKVSCSQPHTWRAVTTIKVGEPQDPYPGDRAVEVTTRDFCADSVEAWLDYPVEYEYGYTYFHAAEWAAGNRRSVCWAKTPD